MGTKSMTKPEWPEDLNDKGVAAWLKAHPDFFLRFPNLIEALKLPGQKMGEGVADFQKFMVEKLKADKHKVVNLQRELIENVRANVNNQNRIQSAILILLEAESLEEALQTITQDFTILLDVDVVSVVIEKGPALNRHIAVDGVQIGRSGIVRDWLGDGDALLQAEAEGHPEIFGPGAGLVKSQALLKLETDPDNPKGILAFGSRVPGAFHEGQGVEQIYFLAQVVERCLRLWLRK